MRLRCRPATEGGPAPRVWISLAAAFLLTAAPASPQEVWFPTEQPEFRVPGREELRTGGWHMFTLAEWEAYFTPPDGAPLREFPELLTEFARIGYNFVFDEANHHFVVDRASDGGYVLYLDMNADGSLLDDRPIALESGGGYHTFEFSTDVTETWDGRESTYPVRLQLVVREDPDPDAVPDSLRFSVYSITFRRGVIQLTDTNIPFTLVGRSGRYSHPASELWIDLDGDGRGFTNWVSDDRTSDEWLRARDQAVTLDGHSYEFSVDRYGRSLALEALGEGIPRPSVDVGAPAPDFVATDINGYQRRLSDYRGKVLLVDFWAAWCGPCRAEAPNFVDLYRKYHERGLDILSVSPDDIETIGEFYEAFGYSWPALQDGFEGQLHKLYRVTGYPTHVVVAKDGTIVGGRIDWNTVDDTLREALDTP